MDFGDRPPLHQCEGNPLVAPRLSGLGGVSLGCWGFPNALVSVALFGPAGCVVDGIDAGQLDARVWRPLELPW